MIKIIKENPTSDTFQPLESAHLHGACEGVNRCQVSDSLGWIYFEAPFKTELSFQARGASGRHLIELLSEDGAIMETLGFSLQAKTQLSCSESTFQNLAELLEVEHDSIPHRSIYRIDGKPYHLLVCWSRDHMYTLNMSRHFISEVKSGVELWLDTQQEDGRFWDCLHPNPDGTPTWFGEALGEGDFTYFDDEKIIARRIPVEADVEYCVTEGVYYVFKSTGDLAWLKQQMPKLEKALHFITTDSLHWSSKKQLVRRSFCMDSWDFANPHYCHGDHRCYHDGDPQFMLHSDNSGLYASYWRMAEMYEALGENERASELRTEGEALRERANRELFFETQYGHMIPETLDPEEVYALVGDERKRMSLSTGYTINRGLPTHEMAVSILDEYRRRYVEKRHESFAEWWTMDPPYEGHQWPSKNANEGPPVGEYMNGGICHISSGELAKAAFNHGREDYGVDILERIWDLSVRDGMNMSEVYKRQPHPLDTSKLDISPLNISDCINRGLKVGAHEGVKAWTDEGDNDMRNLPVGIQQFGRIKFNIVDPSKNDGKAVIVLNHKSNDCSPTQRIDLKSQNASSIYLLHAFSGGVAPGTVVATYHFHYEDGSSYPWHVKNGVEIAGWWGITEKTNKYSSAVDTKCTRIAWQGANPSWKNVGMYMSGWNNPHPEKSLSHVNVELSPESLVGKSQFMIAGISTSNSPVAFDDDIRSYGLPACWANASVFHALYEGLAGVRDTGYAYSEVEISPRWSITGATDAEATLHYPATGSYCTCRYHYETTTGQIELDLSGSFQQGRLHILLPNKAGVKRLRCGREEKEWSLETIEGSTYLNALLTEPPRETLVIELDN